MLASNRIKYRNSKSLQVSVVQVQGNDPELSNQGVINAPLLCSDIGRSNALEYTESRVTNPIINGQGGGVNLSAPEVVHRPKILDSI